MVPSAIALFSDRRHQDAMSSGRKEVTPNRDVSSDSPKLKTKEQPVIKENEEKESQPPQESNSVPSSSSAKSGSEMESVSSKSDRSKETSESESSHKSAPSIIFSEIIGGETVKAVDSSSDHV